jgi:hypothetical protein
MAKSSSSSSTSMVRSPGALLTQLVRESALLGMDGASMAVGWTVGGRREKRQNIIRSERVITSQTYLMS